jgi:hypothetical protein
MHLRYWSIKCILLIKTPHMYSLLPISVLLINFTKKLLPKILQRESVFFIY